MFPYETPWIPKPKEPYLIWERIEYPVRQPVQLHLVGIVSLAGTFKSAPLRIPYPDQHFDYKDRVEA